MVMSWVLGILVLSAMGVLGAIITRIVLGVRQWTALIGLSIPVGGGVLAWVLFLVSWAGVPLTAWSCLVAWVVTTGVALGILASGRPRLPLLSNDVQPLETRYYRYVRRTGWMAFALLVALAIFLSVARAYGSWDAAAFWGLKGYGIAKEGSVFAAENWGSFGLSYPLNIPLQVALFQIFGHDLVPLSKVIFPILLASLGMGAYHFWRRQGVSQLLASLGLVFMATVPLIFLHGTEGYGNLPFAAYFVQGVLWAIVGWSGQDRRALLMGGILLGLASWTRAEGVAYSLAVLLALVASFWLGGKRSFNLVWCIAPLLVIAGSWLLFGWQAASSNSLGGGAFRAAFEAFREGNWHLRELYLIPRLLAERALEVTRWGMLFQVSAVLVLLRLFRVQPRRNTEVFAAFVATAIVSSVAIGLYYVQSYTLNDFIIVLNRSFDRAFFPAASLMIITAIRMYADERVDRSGAVTGNSPIEDLDSASAQSAI